MTELEMSCERKPVDSIELLSISDNIFITLNAAPEDNTVVLSIDKTKKLVEFLNNWLEFKMR